MLVSRLLYQGFYLVSIYLLFTVLWFIWTVFLHVFAVLFGLMTTRLNKRNNYYCHFLFTYLLTYLICHLCVTYGTRNTWDPLLLSHTTKQPDQLFSEDGLLPYKFSCCVCFFSRLLRNCIVGLHILDCRTSLLLNYETAIEYEQDPVTCRHPTP